MKGKTERKDRELSPVGVILHEIQKNAERREMTYDTWLRKFEPSISPTMVSNVRYGTQTPSPLFIQTIIKAYDLSGSIVRSLIKAMHSMLKKVRCLRIYKAVAQKNMAAAAFLEKLAKPESFIGRMKAFGLKWLDNMKHVLKVFGDILYATLSGHYISGRGFVRVPVNAF